MAHPRELISQAVVALLIAAGTSAGSRVYATRFDAHKKTGLPALSVYTLNDPTSEDESSEMEVAHALELEIAGWVAHTDAVPVQTAMNALAEQVEIAMRANEYLSGNASEVVHTGTVMEVVEEDGRTSPVVGVVVMTYSVKYHIALAVT
jgi:hypothetical protein